LQASLQQFRESVETAVPLVQSTAALNDPVPLPEAARHLIRFAAQATGAQSGVLLVRHYDANKNPPECQRAFTVAGATADVGQTPFAQSIAGAAVSRQEACVMNRAANESDSQKLYPFEQGKKSILAAPMAIAPGINAVLSCSTNRAGFPSPINGSLKP